MKTRSTKMKNQYINYHGIFYAVLVCLFAACGGMVEDGSSDTGMITSSSASEADGGAQGGQGGESFNTSNTSSSAGGNGGVGGSGGLDNQLPITCGERQENQTCLLDVCDCASGLKCTPCVNLSNGYCGDQCIKFDSVCDGPVTCPIGTGATCPSVLTCQKPKSF